MKRFITALVCAALCLACSAAFAQLEIEGVIEPAKTLSIIAPYSGRVGDFTAKAGDIYAFGDRLFPLSTEKIYADFDGTVTGVFALPGDSAASVESRYGALMYMERSEIYTAACSTNGSHSDNEDKIVHAGETVFVQSTADSKRDGVGVVTSVSGKEYTVDIYLIDDLRLTDQIKIYRESDHDNDSCIGSGKISRIDPVAVTAQGHVLDVHVKNGDTVERGDLLMEIVPDPLDGRKPCSNVVHMLEDGVLLSVNVAAGEQVAKDQTLATYCPAGEIELVCSVDEEDLAQIAVGDKMTVAFEAMGGAQVEAAVARISAAADEKGEFTVTLALEKTEGVRIGMTATAEK